MSALGHKQTFALQWTMSALHLIADMCSATSDVCFGPIADIGTLFDHLADRESCPRSRRKPQLRVRCTDSARENISREPCREDLSTLLGEPQP